MKKQFTILSILVFAVFDCLILAGQANAETEVGGIIDSNTTWTLANSPYVITDTIQIPVNVTLTIEPGVTINKSTKGDMFLIAGTIYAHGTIDNKIIFDGGDNSDFFDVAEGYKNAFLDLKYSVVRNGLVFWPARGNCGHFYLQYSELTNLAKLSEIYRPSGDININHNKFINTYGFRIFIVNNIKVYIKNNLFYKGHSPNNSKYWNFYIQVYSQDSSEVVIKHNSFIDIDGIILKLSDGSINTFSATENYWGTTDTDIIDSMIYDKNDDITVKNYINYLPILTKPYPDTPTFATCTSWTYSNWSACSTSGIQTRNIISSSPNGCSGGSPILTQSCTYITPTCTSWTYSEWGKCINGQQTRNIIYSSPENCIDGNPILNQTCQIETENNNINNSNSQSVITQEKLLITKVDKKLSKRVSGKILLQVEKKGEGWCVYPDNQKKYYLGKPADAFSIMKNLGLGIKRSELDNYLNSKFPSRLSGKIMLDVEQNGEAYYVNPNDLKGYYLNRPTDAFKIMRELGLGITNNDIRKIDVGEIQ